MHSSLRPDQNIARSTSRAKCWLSILFLFQHTSNAKLCWSHFHDNIVTHGPVFASVEHVLLYERIKIGEYPILRFVRFLRSLITDNYDTQYNFSCADGRSVQCMWYSKAPAKLFSWSGSSFTLFTKCSNECSERPRSTPSQWISTMGSRSNDRVIFRISFVSICSCESLHFVVDSVSIVVIVVIGNASHLIKQIQ